MGLFSKLIKPVTKVFKAIFKPVTKLLKKWLMPKIDQPDRNGYDVQMFGSNNPIPIVYGWNYVAGTVVDMVVTDSPGGIKNENLHLLVVFCVGPVDVVELFIDGKMINATQYQGAVEYTIHTGQPNQTPIAGLENIFQRFDPVNSNFPGLVYAYIKLTLKEGAEVFNGVPEFTAYVSGRKVQNLPSRTAPFWWLNPVVCLYDYLTDPIWGCNLTAADIDLQSFQQAADLCDAQVPVTYEKYDCQQVDGVYTCSATGQIVNTTATRHRISAVIDTGRSLFDNMQQIANCFRGFWPDSDGRVKIGIEQEGTPVYSFDENNVLVNSLSMQQPAASERYNRVTVRYKDTREVTKPFDREVSYPLPGDAQYQTWLDEDNGVPNELTLDADAIGTPWEALQLAIVAARVSRAATVVSFTAMPAAAQCDVGDIVTLSWPDFGWTNKTFRISDLTYNNDGTVAVEAIQHENAFYPWTNLDFDDITGGSDLGDPDNPDAVTALTLVPDPTFAAIGSLQWQYGNNRFIRKFLVVGFRGDPLVEYMRQETVAKELRIDLIPITGETPIKYRVFAVSTTGVLSAAAEITATLNYPAVPTSLGLVASNFEVTAAPVLAGAVPLGTTFDIELTGTTPVTFTAVRSATFTGLASNTNYTFRARTVNAFGKSGWLTQSVTTTANAGPIIDLIKATLIDGIIDDILPELQDQIDGIVQIYDPRQLIPAGVADAFEDLDLSKNLINERTIRREETRTLAAEYNSIRADFTTAQGQNVAQFQQLTTAIADETSARVQQNTLLDARVQQNTASIGTNSTAIANTNSALAVQVTRIDAATSTANAAVSLANRAQADADGNASAIAGLRVAVAGTNSQAQAELILSSTVAKADAAFGRAYLGVTSVSGGTARINGILIDGVTNRIEFRADNVLFTDTLGNPAIYFDTAGGRFVFKGDITASNITGSTLQTSQFGTRTVLSPSRPFWFGVTTGVGEQTHVDLSIERGLDVQTSGVRIEVFNGVEVRLGGSGIQTSDSTGIWIGSVVGGIVPNQSNGVFTVNPLTGTVRSGSVFSSGTVSASYIESNATTPRAIQGATSIAAASGGFDFYAAGTGTYGPFTGSHEALILKDQPTQPGQLIEDAELVAASGISNTITRVQLASTGSRAVVGAVTGRYELTDEENAPAALRGQDIAALAELYDVVVFNAIGEGQLLACGDLQPGDLLCAGPDAVAVKQADDLVRSSTIAKCRQHLTAADGVKLVAVIYLAG